MKKLSKIFALLLTAAMLLSLLAACGPTIVEDGGDTNTPSGGGNPQTQNPGGGGGGEDSPTPAGSLDFAAGTVLRMATGYNSAQTGLFFDPDTAGSGVALADGNTYRSGDLKPTWVEVEKILGMKFENKYSGQSASKEWANWENQLDQVDMVSGTAELLNANGVAGSLVNIAEYLDMMPNFKAYLEANPIVRLSITGDTTNGAIYFSPYFDGVDDIERMPLMRTDWVEKLLNGEGEFTASGSNKTAAPAYQPYMPTSGKVTVDVVKADGSGVEQVTKDYDAAGNIVARMNEAGSMDGVAAVNMLRTYIDEAYGGYYGNNRADLYIGQNAAWDADELVALLRCVVANPQTLNGSTSIQGLHSREDSNMQRKVDMFRFAGTLFGIRGLESRQDYLYVGNDGKLHDARQEVDTYVALERMNAMVKEGLISEAFVGSQDVKIAQYLEQDLGFMHYDYSQTQTIYNDDGKLDSAAGEMYRPVMVPVARWNDGTGEAYFRFTESWRSVKTDGWGISKAGVGGNQDKLNACLSLIDFAYSRQGQILLSYGPSAWVSDKTFTFNGEEWPEISDACRAELWNLQGGNYTNYARYYLGSTLSFLKSQAFEYQCTTEAGRLGAGYVSTAIALGVIRHPELGVASNQWYTSVPTTLPTDKQQNDLIDSYTQLDTQFASAKESINILVEMITDGYNGADIPSEITDAASAANYVAENYNGRPYLNIKNEAWELDLEYYAGLK